MMNKHFHTLCAALFCALTLFSCSSGTNAPESPEAPVTAEMTAAPASDIALISGGSTEYILIRPEESAKEELEAAQTFFHAVNDTCGVKLDFETDYVKKGADPNTYPTEILIGLTNRAASAEAYKKIGEGEFILTMLGERLCAVGYTPELTKLAAEVLAERLTGSGLSLTGDFMEIYEAETTYTYRTFKNPVLGSGADPWVIRDGDAYYYCYSGGNGVFVNKIESLDKITSDGGTKVYTAPEGTMYSAEYWAPELHKIDGKWYIYVAADDGDNYNHRMYVLECTGDEPTDKFEMKGKITDSTDKWAIDGTVLQYKGECYFIWSGWEGDINIAQNIYIAHMSDPWTIDSERVELSRPQFRFEKLGGTPSINEGPVALVAPSGETVHIVYSGSGSWSDFYCLGLLTFSGEGDILDADNWTKTKESIFEKTSDVFGPGHCSFTTAADGSLWIVYHANLVSSSGWGGRSVWTQQVEWQGDDLVLGSPASPSVEHKLPIESYSRDNISLKD
ncbi:MAG: glycoside hydrolase family 43 protein [Clostridia bacterium]|nr:glycoside hydrolase family 43 protein [Clostridia bacterium]